jgi:hypothetical protein
MYLFSGGDMSIANSDISVSGNAGANEAIAAGSGTAEPVPGGNGTTYGGGRGGNNSIDVTWDSASSRPYLRNPLAKGSNGTDGQGDGAYFGGEGGEKGGILRIVCRGDATFTSSTFSARGGRGGNSSSSGSNECGGGGGGGGSVEAVVFGSQSGGTFRSDGGDGGSGPDGAAGGGGGMVALLAPSPDAGASVSAPGGSANDPAAADGGDGFASKITLTSTQLLCLLNRGVFATDVV